MTCGFFHCPESVPKRTHGAVAGILFPTIAWVGFNSAVSSLKMRNLGIVQLEGRDARKGDHFITRGQETTREAPIGWIIPAFG